jgi:5'-3' exonuclease
MIVLIDADSLPYIHMKSDTYEGALQKMKSHINEIVTVCNADRFLLVFTEGKNFRYDIFPNYKNNRTKSKPPIYYALREYLKQNYNSYWHSKFEADDIVSYFYHNRNKFFNEEVIIASTDKDVLKQNVGKHYDYLKCKFVENTQDEANRFLFTQTACGDATDKIQGIYGVGEKTVEKWFKDKTTIEELRTTVLNKFIEYFGLNEGIIKFYLNFRLVYLLKEENDILNVTGATLELPEFNLRDEDIRELEL